jgi:hypothetical protein
MTTTARPTPSTRCCSLAFHFVRLVYSFEPLTCVRLMYSFDQVPQSHVVLPDNGRQVAGVIEVVESGNFNRKHATLWQSRQNAAFLVALSGKHVFFWGVLLSRVGRCATEAVVCEPPPLPLMCLGLMYFLLTSMIAAQR